MKHGKKVNHLGRKVAHRKSMLANMASSLIQHKRINTTLAKAKALRRFVEPLITKTKVDKEPQVEVVAKEVEIAADSTKEQPEEKAAKTVKRVTSVRKQTEANSDSSEDEKK